MKKFVPLAGALLLAVAGIHAQSTMPGKAGPDSLLPKKLRHEPRFVLTVHGGYAIALGSTFKFYPDDISTIREEILPNQAPQKTMSYNSPKKGLGEGLRVGVGISYVLNDFINIGLDIDYFHSTIHKIRDSSYHEVKGTGPGSTDYSYQESMRIAYDATLLTFTPNFTFKAISRPKWFLYNKVGAVVTFRPNSIQHEKQDIAARLTSQSIVKDSAAHNEKRYEWGIKNPSFGFMGAIGAQVKLTARLRAYAELQFSHIVFVVDKRTLTNYTLSGKDVVSTVPESEREIYFSTDFRDNAWTPDQDKPGKAITQRIPITYVGMQAGLAWRF
jgi:hypothetical protein